MNRLRLFRSGNGSTRRLQARRRPIVEDLEGRQLLSNGHHYDLAPAIMVPRPHSVADVQKVREAVAPMSPDAAGQHYKVREAVDPMSPDCCAGQHYRTGVADVQKVREASIAFSFPKV